MKYKYAYKSGKENVVKIVGRDLGISTKQAIEICSFIKNKPVSKILSIFEKVIIKQIPIPFTRFTEGAGHKKGMASGKYPVKASKQFTKLLKTLEANAQNKGLGSELMIIHACAQRASSPMRYGRKRRISMKRTHVEILAEEMEPVKKEKKEKKAKVVEQKKTEVKPETKQDVKKEVKPEEKKTVQSTSVKPKNPEKKVEVKKEIKQEVKPKVKPEEKKEVKQEDKK